MGGSFESFRATHRRRHHFIQSLGLNFGQSVHLVSVRYCRCLINSRSVGSTPNVGCRINRMEKIHWFKFLSRLHGEADDSIRQMVGCFLPQYNLNTVGSIPPTDFFGILRGRDRKREGGGCSGVEISGALCACPTCRVVDVSPCFLKRGRIFQVQEFVTLWCQ